MTGTARKIPGAGPGFRRALRRQRGVVLVIVLVMICLITVVTVQMVKGVRLGYYEAANMRDLLKTACVAKSGFYWGQALLDEAAAPYDALFQKWAQTDVLSAQLSALFDDGHCDLAIEDESGRLNINRLVADKGFNEPVKGVLTRLLSLPQFGLEAQQVTTVVNAIKDYIDADSQATGLGEGTVEPSGYKNAPLDSLEELLAIAGISTDLFYGTTGRPGLSRYLTVYGDGRININTAPRPILMSLADGMTEDRAAAMESFRSRESRELADPTWYRNVPGMSSVTIDGGLIATRSRIFRITSTGWIGRMSQKVTGVIERSGGPEGTGGSRILIWKVCE